MDCKGRISFSERPPKGPVWKMSWKRTVPVFMPVRTSGSNFSPEACNRCIAPGKGNSMCCSPALTSADSLKGSRAPEPSSTKTNSGGNCWALRYGLYFCHTIWSPKKSTPSMFHNWPMSPLGCCCCCPPPIIIIIGFMPPGGLRGALVAGTSGLKIGNGSSKISVGWPLLMAPTKLFICSGPRDEGCTASSTS